MATPPRQETAAKTNNPFRTNQAQNQSLNQGSSPRVRATPAPAPNPFAQQPQSTAALSTSANLNTNGNAGGGADARKAAFQFQWEPAQPKQPVPDSPDAPLPPFHIGMSIDSDRIKLLDFVGQGSFAHVYLGYDYSTSSKCAVKCLMKAGADPKKMAMQKREVDAMRDLNGHPNVIKLIRTVENSEWLLIIMEFCQIDLYEAIMQKGGFPDFAVKDVFSQLCDGVLHCHSRGYYHRDLKPENILLDVASLTAKITDFGLATRDTWSFEMGCGSTRYIPPEACAAADHSKGYAPAGSDVWALGILLINLLFSKNPWFEATMADPIFSIYSHDRPDILRHHFKISAEFDAILHRVFHLDPSKRIPLAEFKRLVNDLPTFLEDTENIPPIISAEPQPLHSPTQQRQQMLQNQQLAQPQQTQQAGHQGQQTKFPSNSNNPFGSSKMQGPLVVFGSIPDPKYTKFQDPKNPFNSNQRGTPMNITSSDLNPFASNNPFSSQPENVQIDQLIQPPVNPFFSIPMAPNPTDSPATALSPFAPHHALLGSDNTSTAIETSPFTTPPMIDHNASHATETAAATLVWTAPSRVAAPDLPNTLTLGREGIGRIGISRLATAKQRLSKRGAIPFAHAGGPGGQQLQQQQRPTFGLAFLGTAIAGYVNPEDDGDEVLEGEAYDSDDLESDEGGAGGHAVAVNRSAPDEESHYEIVKVDRRLIPDLEKGIKRAVNRGMKKFRPFMQLGQNAAGGVTVGGTDIDGSNSNIKLGKGAAGGVSQQEWDSFGNDVTGLPEGVKMPGAFVFASERERRQSVPLLPQSGSVASLLPPGINSMNPNGSSENLNLSEELPLYYTKSGDTRSPVKTGNSNDDLWRSKYEPDSSDDDDLRVGRLPTITDRRSVTESSGFSSGLAKVYNGLAGMNILGGRSKSMKRISERKSRVISEDNTSILPAPQASFAFMVAKNAKSRVTERDFEALVVNAKSNAANPSGSGGIARHRHRVKNKPSTDDPSASMHKSAPHLVGGDYKEEPSSTTDPIFQRTLGAQISPERASPNQLEHGRSSPNTLSLGRPTTATSLSRPTASVDSRTNIPPRPVNYGGENLGPFSQDVAAAARPANPFRPLNLNTNNPFQRPASYHPSSTTNNPFHQVMTLQADQQSFSQQQRYSLPPGSGLDVNPYLAYSTAPQPLPEQSPFFPLQQSRPQYDQAQAQFQQISHQVLQQTQQHPFHQLQQHQLVQPQQEQASLQQQSRLPVHQKSSSSLFLQQDLNFRDGDSFERTPNPRAFPAVESDDTDERTGGGSNESVDSDDEAVFKRGEDRYVRGLVRGFGWLVGGGSSHSNHHVDRSGSQGV